MAYPGHGHALDMNEGTAVAPSVARPMAMELGTAIDMDKVPTPFANLLIASWPWPLPRSALCRVQNCGRSFDSGHSPNGHSH